LAARDLVLSTLCPPETSAAAGNQISSKHRGDDQEVNDSANTLLTCEHPARGTGVGFCDLPVRGIIPADAKTILSKCRLCAPSATFYGRPAPNTIRDTIDLEEAYLAFSSKEETGWNSSFGRRMLNFGETRVIGCPQWSNVSRTYDHARAGYALPKAKLEAVLVSPTIVLQDAFNKPELGNRIWGTYEVFPRLWRGASIDLYALRHSQNKIGGWTGKGTVGTNTLGGRIYGSLPEKFAYSVEVMGQTGHLGVPEQRAYAWFEEHHGRS